jgi:HD-GYP domain-containing protein (c-di-GMP phosphodiesterase class II)
MRYEIDTQASYPRLIGSTEALTVALEVRDSYTRSHCDRVQQLACELGTAYGLSGIDVEYLRISARFHDIGKIGVPDCVLLKPGRLTEDEWVLMRAHALHGERIFRATSLPHHDAVAITIRHHHESFDGSGYPDGLAGENIPLLSRILLVADAYDAMGTARSYHLARNHAQVMSVLDSESGRKFDPRALREFAGLIEHSTARLQ